MFQRSLCLAIALSLVLFGVSAVVAQGGRGLNAARPPKPPRLLAEKENPTVAERNEIVRRNLEQSLEAHWTETEFAKVISDLAALLDVQIVLDPVGLEEAGVTSDQLVTLGFDDTRAESLLKVLLEPLHLTSVVREGYLVVTSEEKAGDLRITRVFNVRDLLRLETATPIAPIAQGGFGGAAPKGEPEARPVMRTPGDKLIDLITTTVAPDSWMETGGTGAIRLYGVTLVVNQTDQHLDEVAKLLEDLREGSAEEKAAGRQ